MMRIILFWATNIAIIIVISIVFNLLGITSILDAKSVGLDFNALLIISAVIGMSGSFISLAMTKIFCKAGDGRAGHRQSPNADRATVVQYRR